MKIVTMPIAKLTAAPYNPRKALKPSDPEYVKLKKSLQEFVYVDPVIYNERTGNVVGGHQRLTVMRDMGMTECEVSVVDLPPAKEKALNIALNKIGGKWDNNRLVGLLEEIAEEIDIGLTGFDLAEIDDMIAKTAAPNLDDILREYEMADAVEKPIWATIRADAEDREVVDRALASLRKYNIRVETSYD